MKNSTESASKTTKAKKRKAEDADSNAGETKKKKKLKKDEPKVPKAPKPKGPVDVERQCGVVLANGAQCARSLTCKSHSMGAKRAVPGRSLPYDQLLQNYQKKNQARQQKAALESNAPIFDEDDLAGGGLGGLGGVPVDSESEKEAVMTGIARGFRGGSGGAAPLWTATGVPMRRKAQWVRMKETLSNALSANRGASLFAVGPPATEVLYSAGPDRGGGGTLVSAGGAGTDGSETPRRANISAAMMQRIGAMGPSQGPKQAPGQRKGSGISVGGD